jgi:hypothetical protein
LRSIPQGVKAYQNKRVVTDSEDAFQEIASQIKASVVVQRYRHNL